MQSAYIPVITIDGPSGTGKGAITQMLAHNLNWHMLDSGAIYRVLAYMAKRDKVDPSDSGALTGLAAQLNAHFRAKEPGESEIWLDGVEISSLIRTETMGNLASQVSKHAKVREALVACQRAYRQAPGLVTDGRDMGTVIFPDASLKFFLTAEPEERARRRLKQLQLSGNDATLDEILTEQHARDARDRERLVAPLKPADDAVVVDTTFSNLQQVFVTLRGIVRERLDF